MQLALACLLAGRGGAQDGGHVRSKVLVVAYAVHETGRREVIGIDLGETETEAFWVEFCRSLRARPRRRSALRL